MILDLYIIRRFLATFLFTLVALSLLFVIIDLFERLDTFIDRGVTLAQATMYYVTYLPFIMQLVIPVCSLLAALFSVGRLAAFNEVTAMRASGQSATRFLAPFIFIAILISCGQVWFNGWIVPAATSMNMDMKRSVMNEGYGESLFNLYFRDTPTRNVTIEYYDRDVKEARGVSIEEFGSVDHPRLQWSIDAESMVWDTVGREWRAMRATRRTFKNGAITVEELTDTVLPFRIRHDQIVRLQHEADELTFDEVEDYIATLKAGGKDTRRQEVEYYADWAFPFSNIIVVLIAVPFASVRRRGGIAVNVAAAMILAFAYIAFTEVSKAIGAVTDLTPDIIGWSANILFLGVALINLILMRR
jgi:lipopolysaccharide export system permease protein